MQLPISNAATQLRLVHPAEDLPLSVPHPGVRTMPRRRSAVAEGALATAALAVMALLIHGYHPYAEDGGLYVSAILKALHPSLYPRWGEFVTVQMQYSLFPGLMAELIRASGLRVSVMVFLLHILSIWATLFGGWLVAARCYASRQARYGAVSLLALWLTIPIAGTSLLLMDPYLTARSISTPCGVLALAAALDMAAAIRRGGPLPWRSVAGCLFCLILACSVHPLMGGFTVCLMALLLAFSAPHAKTRVLWGAGFCLLGVAVSACLYWFGPIATANYFRVEHTRTYWFLHNWHWYEIAGLLSPLLVVELLTQRKMRRGRDASRWIAHMAVAAGLTAMLVALLFAGHSSRSYEVARMQPLRIFHLIYIAMILIVGGTVGERLLVRRPWRWAALFLLFGGLMFYVQRCTFPASGQLELPWSTPRNQWEKAFLWIRGNTPRQALFALDANYITKPGEDAQYFRAVARRSALADYSKDGGLAAIDPQLADAWTQAEKAQAALDTETDARRISVLRPLGVSWIVLPSAVSTAFSCPYRNALAKVCLLPEGLR